MMLENVYPTLLKYSSAFPIILVNLNRAGAKPDGSLYADYNLSGSVTHFYIPLEEIQDIEDMLKMCGAVIHTRTYF